MNQLSKHNTFLFLLLLLAGVTSAQISPGELSNAHAHLEGIKNCTKCHVLGSKETTNKCLECHTEINQLIKNNKGYHSSIDAKGKKCALCHGEHFGRSFKITLFNEITFNHNLTGYKLEEKHNQLKCNECHNPSLIEVNISQKKNKTYLGLGNECISCHEDYHQGTLQGKCVSCHNQNAFRPAPGFNHNNTAFPLVGKHQTTDCKDCHKITNRNEKSFQEFSGINSRKCIDCHVDVHNNKFGSDCRQCHNEFLFNRVNNLGLFSHDQTDFPLRGKHKDVECATCHKSNFTKPIRHQACANCHADYHKKQLAKNGVSPDCKECHSVNGFTPSTYTIEKHNTTNFQLEGAHMATPCFACHQTTNWWNFKFSGTGCINCHDNIHDNYMDKKYMPDSDCRNCHSIETWNDINFNHSVTKFKLEGKHNQVACSACHFSESEYGERTQQFKNLESFCESCHTDVHFNQFKVENRTFCERCHTSENWNPDRFNHNDTRFMLEGEHRNLACIECHKPTDGLIQNYIKYKFKDISCASCH